MQATCACVVSHDKPSDDVRLFAVLYVECAADPRVCDAAPHMMIVVYVMVTPDHMTHKY